MARNADDVRRRLQQAALELYGERGYDRTTTAQIAAKAGVTERTFFRHFADKREVLFEGEAALRALLASGVVEAPETLGPLDALLQAFRSTAPLLEENRPFSEPRYRLVAATPALKERELAKIASLTAELVVLLRRRGLDDRKASLAAQIGMAAFGDAATAWFVDPADGFDAHLTRVFADLPTLLSDAGPERS